MILSMVSQPTDVPRLRFGLRSASGAEVYSWTAPPPQPVLGAFETLPFRTRLASPPADGHDIQVRFFTPRRDRGAPLRQRVSRILIAENEEPVRAVDAGTRRAGQRRDGDRRRHPRRRLESSSAWAGWNCVGARGGARLSQNPDPADDRYADQRERAAGLEVTRYALNLAEITSGAVQLAMRGRR